MGQDDHISKKKIEENSNSNKIQIRGYYLKISYLTIFISNIGGYLIYLNLPIPTRESHQRDSFKKCQNSLGVKGHLYHTYVAQ